MALQFHSLKSTNKPDKHKLLDNQIALLADTIKKIVTKPQGRYTQQNRPYKCVNAV